MMEDLQGLLNSLEQGNKALASIADKQAQTRGYQRACIENIFKLVDELRSKGVSIQLDLKEGSDTEFTDASIESFKSIAKGIISNAVKHKQSMDAYLTAVESGDFDTISRITGQEVTSAKYDLDLGTVEELAKQVSDANEELLDKADRGELFNGVDSVGADSVTPIASVNVGADSVTPIASANVGVDTVTPIASANVGADTVNPIPVVGESAEGVGVGLGTDFSGLASFGVGVQGTAPTPLGSDSGTAVSNQQGATLNPVPNLGQGTVASEGVLGSSDANDLFKGFVQPTAKPAGSVGDSSAGLDPQTAWMNL